MTDGFPDPEDALLALLEDIAPTVTATSDLDGPTIQVNRTGGGADRLGLQDSAIVEVATYAATRPESQALTRLVRERLSGLRGVQTTAGFIDSISEFSAPIPIPDLNPDVRRVPSTWTVVSRLQPLPE
jgi:hypothetical protein